MNTVATHRIRLFSNAKSKINFYYLFTYFHEKGWHEKGTNTLAFTVLLNYTYMYTYLY